MNETYEEELKNKLKDFGITWARDKDATLIEIMEKYFPKNEGFVCSVSKYRSASDSITFYVDVSEKNSVPIIRWTLQDFPGCSGVVVSLELFVCVEDRGKGLAQRAMKCKLEIAQTLGYSQIVALVHADNHSEKHILRKFHFNRVFGMNFTNKRSGNKLYWYMKKL
jgi:hypothetical protein